MRPYLYIILLTIFSRQEIYSQKLKSLIVAEYRVESPGIGNYTYLVAYNFENGILTTKDTLFGAEVTRKNIPGSYVRFDLGENYIYKNRFLISGAKNVIDLEKGNLLYEELDEDYCNVQGDSIIFLRGNEISGIGFIEYSNKKKKFVLKKNSFLKPYNENTSPDKQKKLVLSTLKGSYTIALQSKSNKARLLVADSVAPYSNSKFWATDLNPSIPILWLDSKSFIYAHFTRIKTVSETIISKVSIRKFNIDNDRNETVGIVDSVLQIRNKPYFFRNKLYFDKIGQLVFKCGTDLYKIDTTKRQTSPYDFYELGFGFAVSAKIDTTYGYVLKSKNVEIGQFWCTNEIATDKHLAIEYGEIGSNLAYPKGFKVWSEETNKWTTVDTPWLCTIIGWTDKK